MDDNMDEEGVDVEEEEVSNPDVITKYKTAADISNKFLDQVVKECVPEKKIVDICILGDKLINDLVGGVYKTGKMEKGVAFPTSLSVNHCAGHFSPLADDVTVLKDGDLVKIDLGVHIDGYISVVAHSWVVTSTPQTPTTGRRADVICAAYYAGEIAHRLVKPGKKNTDVTEAINKVAEQFKCQVLEGVLSHQMKRFVIDGNKVVISKSTLEHKVEEFEFEENSVYAIDIVMSTGEGKAREMETRTTVYKRAVDQSYLLKMKAARYVFNEINSRFPTLPFTLRALDEKRGRLGITECLKHDLVNPYPVLYEKQGEFVAQFKFTVLVLPSGTMRLNTHALPYISSEHKLEDPALNAIMQMGTKRAKKGKKKPKEKTAEKKEESQPTEAAPMDTN
jgi:curved DNA binding protein